MFHHRLSLRLLRAILHNVIEKLSRLPVLLGSLLLVFVHVEIIPPAKVRSLTNRYLLDKRKETGLRKNLSTVAILPRLFMETADLAGHLLLSRISLLRFS